MWRWDGVRWVPLIAQPTGQSVARPRTRPWIWWLAGGCALLLVIGVVGAGFGIYSIVHSISSATFVCLPADFPGYPQAHVSSEFTYVGTAVAPGDSKSCRVVLESADDAATVTAFYDDKLRTGDWTVIADLPSHGQIQFQRVSRPQSFGVVDLLAMGQQTEIRIQFDS
jgi:hypothetical protein